MVSILGCSIQSAVPRLVTWWKWGSKPKSKSDAKTAAVNALATPGAPAPGDGKKIKYPPADMAKYFKLNEWPHARPPGNRTGPADLNDPAVQAKGLCGTCWAGGWAISSHNACECFDLLKKHQELGLPAPTSQTHPNLFLTASTAAAPAPAATAPVAAIPAAAGPVTAVTPVAAATSTNALSAKSSLCSANRFAALGSVATGTAAGGFQSS